MESLAIIQKKYTVGISDVDFNETLKVSALFGYFQEIASLHAANLGIGIDSISSKHNVTWVLVKIKVKIDRLPRWNDEITVETWPQNPKRFEFERDYIVRDKSGNTIIRAVSSWVIMDLTTRELKKAELIEVEYPEFIGTRAFEERLGKLKPFGSPELAYKKTIRYSDIDINGHLTNSRYVDYIMDCFPLESHQRYRIKAIQVNYINEALPGETILLNRDVSGIDSNTVYIEGLNDKNSGQIFSCVMNIEEAQNTKK